MNISEVAAKMKLDAPLMAATSCEERNRALRTMGEVISARRDEIFQANRQDLDRAEADGVPAQVQKRLKFDQGKLDSVLEGIEHLIKLPDPVGKVLLKRQLDEGLDLYRITRPIGVIGVIFEARPDALVQISSLCVKSGNCAILKGGKETRQTNRALFEAIREALIQADMPEGCLFQATEHGEIDELLSCDEQVDLIIPRGSNRFVRYIMDHTKIPVMGHAEGICHIYYDQDADYEKAIPLIVDAKTQYPVACNAVETLLVDKAVARDVLPRLQKELESAGITLRATPEAAALMEGVQGELTEDEMLRTEYGDVILSIALTEGVQGAVSHINRYGSHHTDCILTENEETANYFFNMVDSAGVYQNCSTRFADGFRYGLGAEVGISTGKLHARGPVGLEGLVTYQYRLIGHGQIVGDYATGRKQFHFKDL